MMNKYLKNLNHLTSCIGEKYKVLNLKELNTPKCLHDLMNNHLLNKNSSITDDDCYFTLYTIFGPKKIEIIWGKLQYYISIDDIIYIILEYAHENTCLYIKHSGSDIYIFNEVYLENRIYGIISFDGTSIIFNVYLDLLMLNLLSGKKIRDDTLIPLEIFKSYPNKRYKYNDISVIYNNDLLNIKNIINLFIIENGHIIQHYKNNFYILCVYFDKKKKQLLYIFLLEEQIHNIIADSIIFKDHCVNLIY